jgi:hypothetical protein
VTCCCGVAPRGTSLSCHTFRSNATRPLRVQDVSAGPRAMIDKRFSFDHLRMGLYCGIHISKYRARLQALEHDAGTQKNQASIVLSSERSAVPDARKKSQAQSRRSASRSTRSSSALPPLIPLTEKLKGGFVGPAFVASSHSRAANVSASWLRWLWKAKPNRR